MGIHAGADLVGHYEGANFGITWANIFEDEFSMAWIIGLLIIDTFLYAALAWYASEKPRYNSHLHVMHTTIQLPV